MERLGCFGKPLIELNAVSETPASHGEDRGLRMLSTQFEGLPQLQRREDLHKEREYHQRSDSSSLGLPHHSFIAPAAKLESIVVPEFAGDKWQFEYWTQQLEFYLTSTRLIYSSDEVLRQYLLSHLKPGSLPTIIISSERK